MKKIKKEINSLFKFLLWSIISTIIVSITLCFHQPLRTYIRTKKLNEYLEKVKDEEQRILSTKLPKDESGKEKIVALNEYLHSQKKIFEPYLVEDIDSFKLSMIDEQTRLYLIVDLKETGGFPKNQNIEYFDELIFGENYFNDENKLWHIKSNIWDKKQDIIKAEKADFSKDYPWKFLIPFSCLFYFILFIIFFLFRWIKGLIKQIKNLYKWSNE